MAHVSRTHQTSNISHPHIPLPKLYLHNEPYSTAAKSFPAAIPGAAASSQAVHKSIM